MAPRAIVPMVRESADGSFDAVNVCLRGWKVVRGCVDTERERQGSEWIHWVLPAWVRSRRWRVVTSSDVPAIPKGPPDTFERPRCSYRNSFIAALGPEHRTGWRRSCRGSRREESLFRWPVRVRLSRCETPQAGDRNGWCRQGSSPGPGNSSTIFCRLPPCAWRKNGRPVLRRQSGPSGSCHAVASAGDSGGAGRSGAASAVTSSGAFVSPCFDGWRHCSRSNVHPHRRRRRQGVRRLSDGMEDPLSRP